LLAYITFRLKSTEWATGWK